MNLKEMTRPIEILMVEDCPDDVDLTQESLRGTKMNYRLSVVEDGVEAMAFLKKEGKYASSPRPDLVLLDLKLPKKDGHEVLSEIKGNPDLRRIPVVVLTTSQDERDIFKAYDHYASCYVTKPLDLNQLLGVAKWLEDWLTVVKLPKE